MPAPSCCHRRVVRALALVLALLLPLLGVGTARAVDEHSLKAAIVYRLLAFVDWPAARAPSPGAAMLMCIDGAHPMAAPLRELARKPVRQWQLDVRTADAELLPRCHVWVGGVPPAALRGQEGVLVVSDRARQADGVTQVWLALDGDKVGFELDLGTARRVGMQISARLSRLARAVHE